VYASRSEAATRQVREVASTVLRNHLSQLVRLIEEIQTYEIVPERYKSRMSVSMDSVAGKKFVDMRVILTARLLLLSPNSAIYDWVADWRAKTLASCISDFDRRLLRRLVRKVTDRRSH
jgi:hypothetical protein